MARWRTTRRRLVVGGALAVWGSGLVAFLTLVVVYDLEFFGPLGGPWVLAFGAFAITGAVIAWRHPGHVIGVLFLVLGVSAPVGNTITAMAMGPFADYSLGLRTLFIAVSVASTTAIFPLIPLAIMLFPDGRLLSGRWQWIWWVTAAAMALGAVAAFTAGAWGGDSGQRILGPPLEGRLTGVADALSPVFFALTTVLLASSGVAAVLRYRRSQSIARQQMKWLALAALLLLAIGAGLVATQRALVTPPGVPSVVMAVGVGFVPVSAAIAILRHRLYEVDLFLSRTIVLGVLAVFITTLYAALVVGVGSLIGDRSNLVLAVGTTALVAVAFEPVRARVQHWSNVAVYGHRASPYEVLAAIADEMDSTTAYAGQIGALAALLADGTGAAHATVWVQVDGGLRAEACWPVHDPGDHAFVAVTGDAPGLVPDAAHTEAVWNDGDLLGALSFERGRDDPVTPEEHRLIAEMAGQASLVLANTRLRGRLQARLEELRSSRQRLVAAQDEARRKLERDLHDGAQQQLVALKVKLGLARKLAAQEDVGDPTAQLLEKLSVTSDTVIETLRSLARGIYPPLLEAEGLAQAITTQVENAPLRVTVSAEGLARYSRPVEATVYFCVLEALRNTTKHADATTVEIVVEDLDDGLSFRVADDGRGFAPSTVTRGLGLTNMADRLDALGGWLTVETTPGTGVRLRGTIPHPERATPAAPAGSSVG